MEAMDAMHGAFGSEDRGSTGSEST